MFNAAGRLSAMRPAGPPGAARVNGWHKRGQRGDGTLAGFRLTAKMPGGGAGEGCASASMIGLAPAANRSRSAPWTSRPGNGSAAARLASPATGSPRCAAASTRLPNLRPRSTAASAIRQVCGKTEHAVATRARACASGGPSPTFAAQIPAGASTRATATANSAEVRCAGVRPAAKRSATTTSKDPAGISPRTARASAIRTRTRPARTRPARSPPARRRGLPSGSRCRTNSASAASDSTASWLDPGRVAATYRARVSPPPPRCRTRSGSPAGAARSIRCPIRRMYSKPRYCGSSRSTCDCGTPSTSRVQAPGRSGSPASSATPELTRCRKGRPGAAILPV